MKTRAYEGMFLLDNNLATADFDAAAKVVDQILEKNGAKIVRKEKWDERKLAYEIRGHRRATYYLVYFTAPTSAVAEINRDCELAESLVRHLVIALDLPIEEHIALQAKEREMLAEDNRKNALATGWGEPRRGEGRGRREGEDAPDMMDEEVEA
ncbi:MAG: 30S ribosomal protein S6 [Planctomycetia bacterium]